MMPFPPLTLLLAYELRCWLSSTRLSRISTLHCPPPARLSCSRELRLRALLKVEGEGGVEGEGEDEGGGYEEGDGEYSSVDGDLHLFLGDFGLSLGFGFGSSVPRQPGKYEVRL